MEKHFILELRLDMSMKRLSGRVTSPGDYASILQMKRGNMATLGLYSKSHAIVHVSI